MIGGKGEKNKKEKRIEHSDGEKFNYRLFANSAAGLQCDSDVLDRYSNTRLPRCHPGKIRNVK